MFFFEVTVSFQLNHWILFNFPVYVLTEQSYYPCMSTMVQILLKECAVDCRQKQTYKK